MLLVNQEPRAAAEDAVTAFVRRHQRAVWRFARSLGCDGARAEDVAQEALLVALRRGLCGATDGEARAFLRRTAAFLWLREQRAERRRARRHAAAVELRWRQEELLADGDGAGFLAALDECLRPLPPRSRRALERTYRDGVGRAELGRELGIGEHGVRTLLQRLRAALRTCIERRRRA